MQTAIQLVAVALQIGAVYILFSLGLTLIFGAMRIVNFAHGQFFTLSALLVAVGTPYLAGQGWPTIWAFLASAAVSLVLSALIGYLMYKFGFRYTQRDFVGSFILSLGFLLFIEGIFLETFGGAVRSVPPLIEGTVTILGTPISSQRLLLCVVTVVLTAILYAALTLTRLGKALRAIAIDHEAAQLQGVPYQRLAMLGFVIASVMASVAGVLISPVSVVTPVIGNDYLIKGFIAVVVGGLGSVPGAILGSLFIAFVESIGGFFFDPSSASIAVFILVMLVLLVRPRGLLGNA
jgi:branched-chain amino acid transport system permease protein